ncbi:BspA family leucine-rich repeat surface protein [Empedobacter falsenii]
MRKLYFLIFLFLSFYVFGQTPFIIKIEKTADGLFIPITRDEDTFSNSLKYRLTVKNGSTTLINDQTSTALEPNLDIARGRKNHLKSPVIMSVPDGTILTLEFTPLANASPAGFYGLKLGTFPAYDSTFGTDIDPGILRADFAPYAATIREITQWGNGLWHKNLHEFLAFTSNLKITATDKPNLSNVEVMGYAFYQSRVGSDGATAVPGIGSWDFSSLKSANFMFAGAEYFNDDIGNWNVGNVTNMVSMFSGAKSFNQDISRWNVVKVTNMNFMFADTPFNQNIGLWGTKTNKVTEMQSMFSNNSVFNQDISAWDVSNVTSMNFMFSNATSFNQPIGNWNTDKVKGMQFTFRNAIAFNKPLNWNTGEVILAGGMFDGATSFNQPIGNWNTAKMTSFGGIFRNATSFNQPLNWDTSLGRYFDEMFSGATSFNQSLSTFNFSSATDVEDMLKQSNIDCENFANTLIGWASNPLHASKTLLNFGDLSMPDGVSRRRFISSAHSAFVTLSGKDWVIDVLEDPTCKSYDPTKFIIKIAKTANGVFIPSSSNFLLTVKDVNGAIVDQIENIPRNNLTIYTAPAPSGQNHLQSTSIDNAQLGTEYTLEFMNNGSSPLDITTFINMTGAQIFDRDDIKEINQWGANIIWENNLSYFMRDAINMVCTATDKPNFSNVTDMSFMFQRAKAFTADIGDWDVSNVINMEGMFYDANVFNGNIENWGNKTAKVTNMFNMFYFAQLFNRDIGTWDVSSVKNMSQMFFFASSFNGNIENWGNKTANVTLMNSMFDNASLFNRNIGTWDVSSVTKMNDMFFNAKAFNGDIQNWVKQGTNTSEVLDMSSMFYGATSFNQPIETWKVDKVTNMHHMFYNAVEFNNYVDTWNVIKVEDMSYMFAKAIKFNKPVDWGIRTANVKNMNNMFTGATNFNQPLGEWSLKSINTDTNATGNLTDMFLNSGVDCSNFSKTLVGWQNGNTATKVLNLGDTGRIYNRTAKKAYNALLTAGWTINNAIYDEFCGMGCIKEPEGTRITGKSVPTIVISSSSGPLTLEFAKSMHNAFLGFISLDKGLVIPRIKGSTHKIDPKPGMLFYDTDAKCVKLYSEKEGWKCVEKTCPTDNSGSGT